MGTLPPAVAETAAGRTAFRRAKIAWKPYARA